MKIRKIITQKVVGANQRNALKSTGSENTSRTRENAVKHSLTAQLLRFQTREEERAFRELQECLATDFEGAMLNVLDERIARCCLNLSRADEWEMKELASRRKATQAIVRALSDGNDTVKLARMSENKLTARLGWDCEQLDIGCMDTDSTDKELDTRTTGRVRVGVKLTSALESVQRYKARTLKDLYRAMEARRKIQRDKSNEGDTLKGEGE
jgi:hypothetical protein